MNILKELKEIFSFKEDKTWIAILMLAFLGMLIWFILENIDAK